MLAGKSERREKRIAECTENIVNNGKTDRVRSLALARPRARARESKRADLRRKSKTLVVNTFPGRERESNARTLFVRRAPVEERMRYKDKRQTATSPREKTATMKTFGEERQRERERDRERERRIPDRE